MSDLLTILPAVAGVLVILLLLLLGETRNWINISPNDIVRDALGTPLTVAHTDWEKEVRSWLKQSSPPEMISLFLVSPLIHWHEGGEESLKTQLAQARFFNLTVREFLALHWILLLLSIVFAISIFYIGWVNQFLLIASFFALFVLALGSFGLPIYLRERIDRRARQITRDLTDFLDRLTLTVEAGSSFEKALERVAENYPDELGIEMRYTLQQLTLGITRREAFISLAMRAPSEDIKTFAAAIDQSERLGTPLARILRIQSDLMRTRRRQRSEEMGRRIPILILVPLAFCFLPAMVLIYLVPPIMFLFQRR